jgi:hypothetical protein
MGICTTPRVTGSAPAQSKGVGSGILSRKVTRGKIIYTETAGLRQVYKQADLELTELLQEHYAEAGEFRQLEVLA